MKEVSEMDFLVGEVLLFDKPKGWTSFGVVKKVRNAICQHLKIKKIKVGHAGTLDPLASGLLVLCTGRKTKGIQTIVDGRKAYTGTISVGATRPSFDLETEINQEFPIKHIDQDQMESASKKLTGEYLQEPPIFSAKKVDGKRAYELARKGEITEMKKNLITVYSFDIKEVRPEEKLIHIDFEIKCSKGTYIRSIANDFGKLLESGGYLSDLRRTEVGDFHIDQSLDIEQFASSLN